MSDEQRPQVVFIRTVYERGWLGDIFQPVCDELIAMRGPQRSAADILGMEFSPEQTRVLNRIWDSGLYPPQCPEEIVEAIERGNRDLSDSVVNGTVSLALDLKRVVSKKLSEHLGTAYQIR